MNRLLLLAALIIAAPALADDEKKVPVKRVDASTPILQAVQDPATDVDDVASARPQDYNSSRSNNESTRAASGIDYNSSRSNNESDRSVISDGDYNSSRSNNDGIAMPVGGNDLDLDSDGDSIDEAVCGNGVDDDCDSPVDAERMAPANHNTTRSNRTSE